MNQIKLKIEKIVVSNLIMLVQVDLSKSALTVLKLNKNDPQETLKFKLVNKVQISHDTFVFTFEIPNNLELGINVCQHIALE